MTEDKAKDDLNFRIGDNAAGHLLGLVQRIERLEEEKSALGEDITEVYGEAKSDGFDVKALRKVIQLRKQDPADRAAFQELIDTYMGAIRDQ